MCPAHITWLTYCALVTCRSGAPPGFPYGDKVVFVANDWHAGLVPSYLAGKYRRSGVYKVRSAVYLPLVVDML